MLTATSTSPLRYLIWHSVTPLQSILGIGGSYDPNKKMQLLCESRVTGVSRPCSMCAYICSAWLVKHCWQLYGTAHSDDLAILATHSTEDL